MTNTNDELSDQEPTEESATGTYVPEELGDIDEVTTLSLDELDLNDDIGITDPMHSSESAEPYFPPTDPVIEPLANDEGGARVVGGLAPTHDEEMLADYGDEELLALSDDDLARNVYDALGADSLTAGLDIRVLARDRAVTLLGTVPTLDDAEAAESVAGRVPGVVEVLEELTIDSASH